MNYETSLEMESDQTAPREGGRWHDISARFRKRPRWWVVAAAVLVVVLLGWALLGKHGSGDGTAEADAQLPLVSVIIPGATTIAGTIEATGTLAARREMPVGSVGEGGRVISVPVDAGDWVRKGQVLAVIDRSVQSQQVASAQAQLEVARADAKLAQSNLDRALKLVDRGFISKANVDRLTATRDAAVARVRVAAAQLGEKQALSSRLNIVAPAAGLVLTRNVEPGQVVGAGSGVLFNLARGGELELLARMSEEDLSRLSVGASALVTPVGSDKSFAGQIWQLSPTIEEATRQGTARIALSYAPELRPGGFATAVINSGTVVAPMLPESAILSDDEGSFVYVLGEDDKVYRRAVRTGLVTDRGIVISDGLTGREKVVLRAGAFLAEGDQIKPRPVKSTER